MTQSYVHIFMRRDSQVLLHVQLILLGSTTIAQSRGRMFILIVIHCIVIVVVCIAYHLLAQLMRRVSLSEVSSDLISRILLIEVIVTDKFILLPLQRLSLRL